MRETDPALRPIEPAAERAQHLRLLLGTDGEARAVRAPGRVNLMGDHTDYYDGLVLPMAIDRDTVAVAVPREDDEIRILTTSPPAGEPPTVTFADGDTELGSTWAQLAAAIATELRDAGWPWTGCDVAVDATVPMDAGLSSSASFEVAVALAMCAAADMVLDPDTVAAVCRRAETRATGVPVGLMDQLAALRGQAGHALELDCRTLESTQVPIPADISVLVLHSGEPRSLAASAYAQRRAAGEELARRIGVASLRDATPDQVADDPIGRHVVSENARVLVTAEALRRNDRDALADAFAVSHQSLRADYDVSTEALDFLVEGLTRAGAIGARMTGGGFGGCVVALADADDARRIVDQALETARGAGYAPFEIPCTSADGGSVVRLP